MELSHQAITALCPFNKQVTLHDNTQVTVSVFNAKSMIMDISTNFDLMKEENFADRYDIFTGNVDENHDANKNFGEIHTGDVWLPSSDFYC